MNTWALSIGLLLACGLVGAGPLNDLAKKLGDDKDAQPFQEFAKNTGKNYSTVDDAKKAFENFKNNQKNADFWKKQNKGTAEFGQTKFSDLAPEDFLKKFTGYKQGGHVASNHSHGHHEHRPRRHRRQDDDDIPDSFDYRDWGVVAPVKNQGQCGICVIFTATAVTESAWALAGNDLVALSEEQVARCHGYGRQAGTCGSTNFQDTFRYIYDNGICTESNLKFTGQSNKLAGTCPAKKNYVAHLTGFDTVLQDDKDESKIIEALYWYGPLAVAIDASPLQSYKSGILNSNPPSKGWGINHAVTLVGYTPTSYILKNSWGPDWGEKGFFRMARNKNMLNICHEVVTAYAW